MLSSRGPIELELAIATDRNRESAYTTELILADRIGLMRLAVRSP